MVAGAGGLLCPGSPVVLGDIGRLVEDVVDVKIFRVLTCDKLIVWWDFFSPVVFSVGI